jgi:hypothetical protein
MGKKNEAKVYFYEAKIKYFFSLKLLSRIKRYKLNKNHLHSVSVKKNYEEIQKILRKLVTWRKIKHFVNARPFDYGLSRM